MTPDAAPERHRGVLGAHVCFLRGIGGSGINPASSPLRACVGALRSGTGHSELRRDFEGCADAEDRRLRG